MHYDGKITIDADFEKDMKLPFKTYERVCGITITTILPYPIQAKVKNPEAVFPEYTIKNDGVTAHLLPSSIFQPPRAW